MSVKMRVEKALAVPLDHLGDAAGIGDVGADADDHEALMPRTLAALRGRDPSPRASP